MPIGENTYYPWRIGDYPPYQPVTPWWAQRPCWGHPLPNGVDISTGTNTKWEPYEPPEESVLSRVFREDAETGEARLRNRHWRVEYDNTWYDIYAQEIENGYLGESLVPVVTFKTDGEVSAAFIGQRGWHEVQDAVEAVGAGS